MVERLLLLGDRLFGERLGGCAEVDARSALLAGDAVESCTSEEVAVESNCA